MTIRIMALGDSITQAANETPSDPGGYRNDLQRILGSKLGTLEFVGPFEDGPSGSDRSHAGIPGNFIDGSYRPPAGDYDPNGAVNNNIFDRLSDLDGISNNGSNLSIESYQPDAILLMIGTNDIGNKDTPANAANRLKNLVNTITERVPDARIFVASIVPFNRAGVDQGTDQARNYQNVDPYNTRIPVVVNELAQQGKQVTFVDVSGAIKAAEANGTYNLAADYNHKPAIDPNGDVLHPGPAGYAIVAQTWATALEKAYQPSTLVWNDSVWFLENANPASRTAIANFSLPSPYANWAIRGTGDFNGDGVEDWVIREQATGRNAIALLNPDALGNRTISFSSVNPLEAQSADWSLRGVGDLDDDGQDDLVWNNTSTGQFSVWYMNANRTKRQDLRFGPNIRDAKWQVETVGDFTGDDKADLVLRNLATGQNVIWEMNGVAPVRSIPLDNVSREWELTGSGDYNADQQTDLVWRNGSTGQNVVWAMNGTAIAQRITIESRSGPAVIVQN
ncbi:MAG: hypothetical protein HC771_07280 [Synechococcales cyanobacterium CRU_2_2]|nr:hypothetical protein [Synechococcales cyanobacterium CRU_2_2]